MRLLREGGFFKGGVYLRSVLDRVLDRTVREGSCLDRKEELCFVY